MKYFAKENSKTTEINLVQFNLNLCFSPRKPSMSSSVSSPSHSALTRGHTCPSPRGNGYSHFDGAHTTLNHLKSNGFSLETHDHLIKEVRILFCNIQYRVKLIERKEYIMKNENCINIISGFSSICWFMFRLCNWSGNWCYDQCDQCDQGQCGDQ